VVAGGLAAKATNTVYTSSMTRLASPVTATPRDGVMQFDLATGAGP